MGRVPGSIVLAEAHEALEVMRSRLAPEVGGLADHYRALLDHAEAYLMAADAANHPWAAEDNATIAVSIMHLVNTRIDGHDQQRSQVVVN
jgi:hypothetical protein